MERGPARSVPWTRLLFAKWSHGNSARFPSLLLDPSLAHASSFIQTRRLGPERAGRMGKKRGYYDYGKPS